MGFTSAKLLCDVIKQNESELPNINFEIQSKERKTNSFTSFVLFYKTFKVLFVSVEKIELIFMGFPGNADISFIPEPTLLKPNRGLDAVSGLYPGLAGF